MARMADSPDFRNKLEERLGTERYEELARPGQQDKRKGDRISGAEARAEFRERPKGVSVNEGDNSMVSKYQNYVDNGLKFNNNAKAYLISQGVDFSQVERKPKLDTKPPEEISTPDPVVPINGPITTGPINIDTGSGPVTMPAPVETPYPTRSSGGNSYVMDNDQINTQIGNNNISNQYQDNSIIDNDDDNYRFNPGMTFKNAFMNKMFT